MHAPEHATLHVAVARLVGASLLMLSHAASADEPPADSAPTAPTEASAEKAATTETDAAADGSTATTPPEKADEAEEAEAKEAEETKEAAEPAPLLPEAWFTAGKAWMAAGELGRACRALEQSYALEPATGALLATALCHERQDRLLEARAEYVQVAKRAEQEKDLRRRDAALARVAAIDGIVSTVTIEAVDDQNTLELALDGHAIGPEQFGKEIPLGGGKHAILVQAAGKKPLSLQFELQAKGDRKDIIIPALEPLPEVAPVEPAPAQTTEERPPKRDREPRSDRGGLSPTEWIGIATMGLGAVGIGVGTYYAIREADDSGPGDMCKPGCDADDGDLAALGLSVGGMLLATGAITYFFLDPSSGGGEYSRAERPALAGGAWVLPGGAGATVHGHF